MNKEHYGSLTNRELLVQTLNSKEPLVIELAARLQEILEQYDRLAAVRRQQPIINHL